MAETLKLTASESYRDVFRLAGPEPLLRPALFALGLAGRLAGNRTAHDAGR